MDLFIILWSSYSILVIGGVIGTLILHFQCNHGKVFRSILLTSAIGLGAPFIIRPLYVFIVPSPVPSSDFFHSLAMGIGWAAQAEINTFAICLLIMPVAFLVGFLMVFKSCSTNTKQFPKPLG